MTVVVGANPFGDARAAVDLGMSLVRTLPEATRPLELVIATVVPPGWQVPSMAKVDGEMQAWLDERTKAAEDAARAFLGPRADDVTVEFVRLNDRSTPRALAGLAEARQATALVLGSATEGGTHGRVVIGSTADFLLHSSPVPLAIAPRGYLCAGGDAGDSAHRLTCSFGGTSDQAPAVRWAAALTREIDVQLRVASFGVQSRTMYPPEIGMDIESEVNAQWQEQVEEAQAALRARLGDEIDDDATFVVASGTSWADALASIDWEPNELLILGSSTSGTLRRVFLGTRATKIVRYSPVPVLVVPRDAL